MLISLANNPFELHELYMLVCTTRNFRKKGGRLKMSHGIWWIMNLMYSHIIYTSMTILSCPKVVAKSDVSSLVHMFIVSCGDIALEIL